MLFFCKFNKDINVRVAVQFFATISKVVDIGGGLRGQSPPINITGNPPNFGGLIHFMIPLFSCFFWGGGEKIQYNMEFNSLN